MEENLKKKIELCERAEAMKDSTDWKNHPDMINIQKEWKTIGIVPRKYVDVIWKRFIGACDYFWTEEIEHFFTLRRGGKKSGSKRAVVQTIKDIDKTLEADSYSYKLRELMDQ